MDATLTFLGTGTSMGVPTLGCECAVCTSTDPHDYRLRPSAALRWQDAASEHTVVVDTGPDFRTQAIHARLKRIDAVFYTHAHADHIMGLDDLRPLSFLSYRECGPIPLYAAESTQKILRRIFDYTFSPDSTYPNRARVELKPLEAGATVAGVGFTRVPVQHGHQVISGLRFGRAAYLTDVSGIPESSFPLLEGVETLVLSALRHKPHATHATIEQAVAWAQRIGARHTWFTHISHDLGHEVTNHTLPEGIQLAHDGLTVPVQLGID